MELNQRELDEWDYICATANKNIQDECCSFEDQILVKMHKHVHAVESSRDSSAEEADRRHKQVNKLHIENGRLRSLLIDSVAALDPCDQKVLITRIDVALAR